MRLRVLVTGFLLLAVRAGAGEAPVLDTTQKKTSYALGVETGRNLRPLESGVDLDALVRGIRDGLSGESIMGDKELQEATSDARKELMRKQSQAVKQQKLSKDRKADPEENRRAGEAFLAENGKKEGVVTLPSGLQYRVLKAGDGKVPTDNDTVVCNYRGTRLDGTEFGSSNRVGSPATFKVKGEIIPGLTEALKIMPTGSKWQLFLPSDLAYGERGAGTVIGPNETIVFELELLTIK